MDWRTTYPTIETLMEMSFETLSTLADSLPPPQTDVERTVMRRLLRRRDELGMQQLKEVRPDLHESIESIYARLDKLGIKVPRP